VDAGAEPAASDLSLGQATSGSMDWVPSSEEHRRWPSLRPQPDGDQPARRRHRRPGVGV